MRRRRRSWRSGIWRVGGAFEETFHKLVWSRAVKWSWEFRTGAVVIYEEEDV
jgi:hypothetical protein